MGNPTYITLTSSGSSPWFATNWQDDQFEIGLAIRTSALSSNWQIDITMDDPFGTFPSSAGPTIFQSSQVGGSGSSVSGVALSGGSSNSIGSITTPIAALRLTTGSTGGAVTLTVLQSGIA